jgi:hypothetical protein
MYNLLLLLMGIFVIVLGCISLTAVFLDKTETQWYSKFYWSYYRFLYGNESKNTSRVVVYGIIGIFSGLAMILFWFIKLNWSNAQRYLGSSASANKFVLIIWLSVVYNFIFCSFCTFFAYFLDSIYKVRVLTGFVYFITKFSQQ